MKDHKAKLATTGESRTALRWSGIPTAIAMLATAATSFPAYAADPLNFKGVEIGKPIKPAEFSQKLKAEAPGLSAQQQSSMAKHFEITCGVGTLNSQVCNGRTTIAGSLASINGVIDAQGVLQRILISFPSDTFRHIEAGLREKFGPPTSEELVPVQNL
jgi:hypothetical protein